MPSALRITTTLLVTFAVAFPVAAADFSSSWQAANERVWIGPEYWSNPLQDWRLHNGRLECVGFGPNRNVHVLTRQLEDRDGAFTMSVRLGLTNRARPNRQTWAGFRVAARGQLNDYRDNVMKGRGIDMGISGAGLLFIGDLSQTGDHAPLETGDVVLRLEAKPAGARYGLTLSAHDPDSDAKLGQVSMNNVPPARLVGNLALVCHAAGPGRNSARHTRPHRPVAWFRDWRISGDKAAAHDDRAFGPILFAQHTLSRGVMKMTAQMPPVSERDAQIVRLEIQRAGESEWTQIATSPIHKQSCTATFRTEDWEAARDVPYRLAYSFAGPDGTARDHHFEGTVRRDPVDKESISVAAFTGNTDPAFPNSRIVENVRFHDPDVMVFTGDQIYESVGGYGIQRLPLDIACLDYLRKWWMLGWAFGDLMRDRVTICMPDDHDVYQGNIWGAGGRATTLADHDAGGYVMHPEWVNAVQRTQTSHLPDPFDPAPIEQNIGVYYTDMTYGRISFAIIEDRKFKSGPKGLAPQTRSGRPDHIIDADFDPKTADVPGAVLLGPRQLEFLRHWAADWEGADMKTALSQTIFANVANYHGRNQMHLVADLDSNGWPQTGRNKALHELRRCFAFMIGGDQHLASIVHHGIDDFDDAGISFCTPSIAAGYPRSWHPGMPGMNRKPGAPEYAGQYLDGLGNHVNVMATANPRPEQRRPVLELLHDKSSGHGIIRFNKRTRKITIECWPLLADPADAGQQFTDWPQTIDMLDNYGRKPVAWLPMVKVEGMQNPVVQVVEQSSGEAVYTFRISGDSFRPKVFAKGKYTIHVGEPAADRVKTFTDVDSILADETREIRVAF